MDQQKEILKEIDLWLTEKNISKKCPECKSELTLFWKGKDSFMKVQGLILMSTKKL